MKNRFFLALAVLLLLIVFSPPRVSGHSEIELSGYTSTAPTIDGNISPSEWAEAAVLPLQVGDFKGTIYEMNDASNLYLAVTVQDPTFSTNDEVRFYFDNKHDGSFDAGDDVLSFAVGRPFADLFKNVDGRIVSDSDFGGRTDGMGAAQGSGGVNTFEIQHPLCSPDTLHDFCLKPGQIVGFTLEYFDAGAPQGFWPAFIDSSSKWGDIKILPPPQPVSLSAFTKTPPDIDGIIDTATEWANADRASFTIAGSITATVYVMNDLQNLYIAITVNDPDLSADDRLSIDFDNNNDGRGYGLGDDALQLFGNNEFRDLFYNSQGQLILDTQDGGSNDGAGIVTASGGINSFELQHPLCSEDRAHDFCLSPTHAVGFAIGYRDEKDFLGRWPSDVPSQWAHIVIAEGPSDFRMSTSGSRTVNAGESASYTVNVTPQFGFNSVVTLGTPVLPDGITSSFSVGSGVPPFSSTVTLSTRSDTPGGNYSIVIQGSGGGTVHTTTAILTVIPPPPSPIEFSLSASPQGQSVVVGSSTAYTITVSLLSGNTAPVALSVSGLPPDTTAAFFPVSGLPSFTSALTITTGTGTPSGTYSLTIRGSVGSQIRETTANLAVSRCLIATAAYGSELAPEVQTLREFRDNQVMKTFAGREFMKTFDSVYYSFSPQVAQKLNEYQFLKYGMRIGLYPLILSLKIGSAAYDLFEQTPELAVISAGTTVSLFIGTIYLAPAVACLSLSRPRARIMQKLAKFLAVSCGVFMLGLLLGEITQSALLLRVASSGLVLALMFSSGFAVGWLASRFRPWTQS